MNYANIKAVLFDHDGTLVDSEKVHYELWAKTIEVGLNDFTPDMFAENLVGIPTKGNAAFLIEQFGLPESVNSLVAKKAKITRAFLQDSYFPAIGDARGIMQQLHSMGIRMAIVSGSERYAVDRSVAGNGFGDFIEHITTGEEVPDNKPAPDVYLRAMEKMQLSPEECLAVEDTDHGLSAATAAGIECFAIPNEHTQNSKFANACARLNSLNECSEYFQARI